MSLNRKLRMGMVGGGRDSFIGAVHRMASQLDGQIELVCGAFSSTRKKSRDSGADLYLNEDRVYGTYREMLRREAKLPESERMDFVSIVTPNNMHYPIAMASLDAGFHVVCDKPMTLSIDEAKNLNRKLQQTGKLFCLTHNYTGHPLVREARQMIAKGKLGEIRRVVVEYPQDWLATRMETAGLKQAMWRTDPRRAGASCCIGDIGSHCENLVEFMTGLRITEISADLNTFVSGRPLDDDGSVLLRFENGAKGLLWASQIAVGEENALTIRVYGEKGGLEWHQQEPNTLLLHMLNKPTQIYRTGGSYLSKVAASATRLPMGHPEGYLEAFANIYGAFAHALTKTIEGKKLNASDLDFPSVQDGIRGVVFIEAVVQSSQSKDKWLKLPR